MIYNLLYEMIMFCNSYRQLAGAIWLLLSYVYFDMFLEKIVLKDVSSKNADWIRDLRFILIAAQKNYVLDAPLGDRPMAGADADIMNV